MPLIFIKLYWTVSKKNSLKNLTIYGDKSTCFPRYGPLNKMTFEQRKINNTDPREYIHI